MSDQQEHTQASPLSWEPDTWRLCSACASGNAAADALPIPPPTLPGAGPLIAEGGATSAATALSAAAAAPASEPVPAASSSTTHRRDARPQDRAVRSRSSAWRSAGPRMQSPMHACPGGVQQGRQKGAAQSTKRHDDTRLGYLLVCFKCLAAQML